MSANTPHMVFDKLEEQSHIPLISIVEATCEKAKHRGLKKLGLLGTIFTMTGDFFKDPFLKNGIEVIIPTEIEMELINDKISTELELGIQRKKHYYLFRK